MRHSKRINNCSTRLLLAAYIEARHNSAVAADVQLCFPHVGDLLCCAELASSSMLAWVAAFARAQLAACQILSEVSPIGKARGGGCDLHLLLKLL
jgi:hypothetical protein